MRQMCNPTSRTRYTCNADSYIESDRMFHQIFIYSGEKWGFDFCAEDFVADANGMYAFEDTFEMWVDNNYSSNTMASARWDHVTNGRVSGLCGVGAGEGTMMFSGANYREAETLDMDMRWDLSVWVISTREPRGMLCCPGGEAEAVSKEWLPWEHVFSQIKGETPAVRTNSGATVPPCSKH